MSIIPRSEHRFLPTGQAGVPDSETDGQSEVVVRTRELAKVFRGIRGGKKTLFRGPPRRDFRSAGPQRRRQEHHLPHALRPARRQRRRDQRRRPRPAPFRARARGRLGYMAQQFSLYGQLSPGRTCDFSARLTGWTASGFSGGSTGPLRSSSLANGGTRQPAPCRAATSSGWPWRQPCCTSRTFIFLDEPTSGVDPFARREFWLRINGFAEQGVTVVVTTHFMEEAEYCDRMLIMSQGDTLAMGTPAEIRALARSAENPRPTIEDAFIALGGRQGGAPGAQPTAGAERGGAS